MKDHQAHVNNLLEHGKTVKVSPWYFPIKAAMNSMKIYFNIVKITLSKDDEYQAAKSQTIDKIDASSSMTQEIKTNLHIRYPLQGLFQCFRNNL